MGTYGEDRHVVLSVAGDHGFQDRVTDLLRGVLRAHCRGQDVAELVDATSAMPNPCTRRSRRSSTTDGLLPS